jgi:hypothetical protein
LSNVDAAGRVAKELGAEIVVIKKTSTEYGEHKDPQHCPPVLLNGRIIARNDTITYESLKAALLSDSDMKGGRL